jgi:hypothetical protein
MRVAITEETMFVDPHFDQDLAVEGPDVVVSSRASSARQRRTILGMGGRVPRGVN